MKPWQFFAALFAIVAISSRGQTPLPDTISIESPSSTVSRQAAAFSGAWLGVWGYELPGALIVESISSNDTAKVIYSWGDLPARRIKAGWIRQIGQISNGALRLTSKNGPRVNYTFEPNGTLQGRYEIANSLPAFATFYRVASTNSAEIQAAAQKGAGVRNIQVRDDGLRGTLFLPAGKGPWPGVIVLGGSDGGLPGGDAAFLATKGDAALALAYFHYEDLPQSLENIPLEYFQTAIHWLQASKYIEHNNIAVLGASRGGELALLLGATFPEIHAVVAMSPSSVVWGGLGTNANSDEQPAWTYQGKPLPFLDSSTLSPKQWEQVASLSKSDPYNYVPWYQAVLADKPAVAKASIAVEKINGPVLLVSGNDDKLWPSTQMSDMVMKRLRETRHPFPDRHLAYPGAGHYIPLPNTPVSTNVFTHPIAKVKLEMGGDPKRTEAASADVWPRIIDFLNQSLSDDTKP
ncbi:MAG TPA: acyl-CoA thioester hydrolase/BAAT C-terminal domain-containing protein [Verrucomicrobiae bacterium]